MKINITKPVWAQYSIALEAIFFIAFSPRTLAQPAPDEAGIPYTIKSRDKLVRLSAELLRQPSDWPEVTRFNPLKNPTALKPGALRSGLPARCNGSAVRANNTAQRSGAELALGQGTLQPVPVTPAESALS